MLHNAMTASQFVQCRVTACRLPHNNRTASELSDSIMQVIMFDPMYDAYGSMARRAGGTVKAVKLNVEDWSVDRSLLKEAFSDKTKLIVVNTPHNPTGKVFCKGDLQFIADLAIKYNAYVLLDEVSACDTSCCTQGSQDMMRAACTV